MLRITDNIFMCSFNQLCTEKSVDKVNLYAKHLLSLGLFYLEFSDAIKEGDGSRVLRCYRYMLPVFISSARKNYAIESIHFLMQNDYLLSRREAAELLWSQFVNTHGHNIPNDLHMEHLNRVCKGCIEGLGPNQTAKCITPVGKALGTIDPILDNFDEDNCVPASSGRHRTANSDEDLNILIHELQHTTISSEPNKRQYPSFPNPRDPLHAITRDD